MPKEPSEDKEFRPRIASAKQLFKLAAITRRRPIEEANIAVDNHLAANRALLKRGPKLSK